MPSIPTFMHILAMHDQIMHSIVLTPEAFYLWVASPAIRTEADGSVLLSATLSIATTRIFHQARVDTNLTDACLVTWAVWVNTTDRLHLRDCCK